VNLLIVTWWGGGAALQAIGLGRLLARRGHRVRVLAPAAFAPRIEAAGCAAPPYPPALEFDAEHGRMVEDQWDWVLEVFFSDVLPDAVAAELAEEPADVVVVDYLLRSVVNLAEALPAKGVVLMHMIQRFHDGPVDESTEVWSQRWQFAQLNTQRARLGLDPLPVGPAGVSVSLVRRAAATLVVITRAFDPWPDPPDGVVHVGPLPVDEPTADWDPPWPEDDGRPLIVVSLGSMYMRHEELLARISRAAAGLDARVLMLTGHDLAPDEVAGAAGVYVRSYVPHKAVFTEAALVVTHGGLGTLMAAFEAGVPTLCLPLGRDQELNARQAQELGASRLVSPEADADELRRELEDALSSEPLREAAGAMAENVGGYQGGARAVAVLEELADRD
jgi:MGT family glycosyltransferase